MKFAKELERDAVPGTCREVLPAWVEGRMVLTQELAEWRIKYLNYKAGKKHIKAVSRALNRTPRPRGFDSLTQTPRRDQAQTSLLHRPDTSSERTQDRSSAQFITEPRPQSIPRSQPAENEALTQDGQSMHYGSFVPTPPAGSPALQKADTNDFELPAPALKLRSDGHQSSTSSNALRDGLNRIVPRRSISLSAGAANQASHRSMDMKSKRLTPTPSRVEGTPHLKRLFSHVGPREFSKVGYNMDSFDLVRVRQDEFFDFLDSELHKVESFYKLKEQQAGDRLTLLREQLHEMRNRRIQEIADPSYAGYEHPTEGNGDNEDERTAWMQPLKAKLFRLGPNSKALQTMTLTPHMTDGHHGDAHRDYVRRPKDDDVSYRTAKRKLKLALQEFYRGLELLKSYALLNRTAFRKLNKKFDKAVQARPPYRYMNDKVNEAWFVKSDVLEGHISAVEDLYARYFERGNFKLAAGKLRNLGKKRGREGGSSFRNGIMIGTGAVFAIQGLVYGSELLFDSDQELRTQTSYLLQIYGGYFLMLLLFSWFCINGWVWSLNKVNYPFIFEFDPRHHLHWKRLAVFPSFFLLLGGVVMWFNFGQYGPHELYLYYPTILIGLTACLIFLPAPIFEHRSRRWLAYSHVSLLRRIQFIANDEQWRLLLAGLYPVEFRDFFLGDMYCSLTYAMAVSSPVPGPKS